MQIRIIYVDHVLLIILHVATNKMSTIDRPKREGTWVESVKSKIKQKKTLEGDFKLRANLSSKIQEYIHPKRNPLNTNIIKFYSRIMKSLLWE